MTYFSNKLEWFQARAEGLDLVQFSRPKMRSFWLLYQLFYLINYPRLNSYHYPLRRSKVTFYLLFQISPFAFPLFSVCATNHYGRQENTFIIIEYRKHELKFHSSIFLKEPKLEIYTFSDLEIAQLQSSNVFSKIC
ncbi:hypothetical protein Hanom_Chr17g01549171 [Helianthus anomalus]